MNTKTSGLRSICDMSLQITPPLAEISAWISQLQAGDVVVGRNDGNWISRLISDLDGFWTHSSIYVGAGKVVHAFSAGIAEVTLETFIRPYMCVGAARPNRSATERSAAAAWALEVANRRGTAVFSGQDLGSAFAMLRRVQARDGLAHLPELDPNEADSEDRFEAIGADFESTCSGLVYQAYRDGAGTALAIEPAPGLRLVDDKLALPDDGLLEMLLQDRSELEAIGRDDLRAWRIKAQLLAGAAAGWASYKIGDSTLDIDQGVTPGDLWCSPEINHRVFLLPEHADRATELTSHCGETIIMESSNDA